MKRNSKRFLALFLSVAMTVTPAALTQAESESTGVQVTVTPAEEAVVTEAPKEETAPAQEEKAETTAPEETRHLQRLRSRQKLLRFLLQKRQHRQRMPKKRLLLSQQKTQL